MDVLNEGVDKTEINSTNSTNEEVLSKDEPPEENKRFQLKWTKLDNGSKLNRITHFIKLEKLDKNLSDAKERELKILLTQLFKCGHLNRGSDVDYDEELCRIRRINNLSYSKEDKTYSFKTPKVKRSKSCGKGSRSRIERHFRNVHN